jgi:hypothetical protein
LGATGSGAIAVSAATGRETCGVDGGARDESPSNKAERSASCFGVAVDIISIIADIVSVMLLPGGDQR